MKIKNGYVLRLVASKWVVLPVGEAAANFNGMISLNDSGVLLWKALEEGKDSAALVDALMNEYEVEREIAESDVKAFLAKLANAGCIEE